MGGSSGLCGRPAAARCGRGSAKVERAVYLRLGIWMRAIAFTMK